MGAKRHKEQKPMSLEAFVNSNGGGRKHAVLDSTSGEYGDFGGFLKMIETPGRWGHSLVTEMAVQLYKVNIVVMEFLGSLRGKPERTRPITYVHMVHKNRGLETVEEVLRKETWVVSLDGPHYQFHQQVADEVRTIWRGVNQGGELLSHQRLQSSPDVEEEPGVEVNMGRGVVLKVEPGCKVNVRVSGSKRKVRNHLLEDAPNQSGSLSSTLRRKRIR